MTTKKKPTLHERLLDMQSRLKVPKNQYNNFGKYSYRSCEDILEAVKPLLSEHSLILKLNDEIINLGDRFYVQATVALIDIESDQVHTARAYAREEENKKGMDGSQVTGAASSYARKYALNGLFCLDDNKDSDETNKGNGSGPHTKAPEKPEGKKDTPAPKAAPPKESPKMKTFREIVAIAREAGLTEDDVRSTLKEVVGKKNGEEVKLKDVTMTQLGEVLKDYVDKAKAAEEGK